ncbi:metal ABC transporter substrate-binding protein [Rhodococcus rhodnii]|uniref:ABC metal ion transporter n=2 Tax=Rhodococcus rhodnii TaxID=38312 RepID=R7WJK2_9NOCA|nr:metal ABC transporter substrate-binding protein [Rhodococcus rhodnii]EOM75486.1 ABC metal ion transporter [Rhodococcus rhodnii LMG 5362]TXG90496.1 metal ABC transporter substrate-binding protein [Rhodococcus rhodnii]
MRISKFGHPKLVAVLGAALVATACASPDRDDRPVALTTFTVLADIAAAVGGDDIRVESITSVGAEVHGYDPTPRDVARAQDAAVIVDNGLGLEAWFEQFLTDVDAPRIVASEGITPIDIADRDGSTSTSAGKPNPHAWMSPHETQVYVANIVEAFSELDPDNAADYRERGERYSAELETIRTEMTDALAVLPPEQRVLVTCEGAFSYLARDAGLTEHYLWPVNAEQQATPASVASAIEVVRDNSVPAVFCESTVSDAAMQQVVDATDARFGGTLYVDSLSEPDGPVPTYLDLLRYDVDTIVSGLTGGTQS